MMAAGYRLQNHTHTPTPPKKKNPRRKTPPQNPDTLCFCNPCPNRTRAQPSSQHVWLLLLGFEQLGDLEMGLANTIQIQLAKEAWTFQLPSGQMWAEPLQRVNHRATCASSTNKLSVSPHPTHGCCWSGNACHSQTLPFLLDPAKTRFPAHGLGEGRTNRSGEGEHACTQVQRAGSQTKGDRRSRYRHMQATVLVSTAFYKQDQRQGKGG